MKSWTFHMLDMKVVRSRKTRFPEGGGDSPGRTILTFREAHWKPGADSSIVQVTLPYAWPPNQAPPEIGSRYCIDFVAREESHA